MDIWTEIARDRERGARRLVAEYGDRLLTAAFQMTQNRADAEDLAFRTFAQVVSKIDTYAGRSPFFTWVYRILLNFRRMDLRKKGANALALTDELPEDADPAPDPAEALALRASAAEVRAAVAELPETLRTAVVLRYFEEMDVAQVADVLEISVSAAKVRLFAARRRLAKRLVLTDFRKCASNADGEGNRQIGRTHP